MPKRRNQQAPDPQAIAEFAGGADMASRPPADTSGLPWRDPALRLDIERNVLAPLPEDYRAALKWLAENRHIKSQRHLAATALRAEIDRLVTDATGEPVRSSRPPE